MSFQVNPLQQPFGAEITDVDLAHLDDEELRSLLTTLYEKRFLVIRMGGLSRSDLVTFARRIGDPLIYSMDAEHPEIIPITNIGIDSAAEKRGAAHWHSDQSFTERRASITMLYSRQAPKAGGATRFCDMVAAYHALPEAMRERIENLVVEHRHGVSISARPGDHVPIPPRNWDPDHTVYHPLVDQHPITGEKCLYAITGTCQGIEGMSQEHAALLLDELCEHALRDPFIAEHQHRVDDLVMWDNPTTMHSATPIPKASGPDDTREIDRISLRGTPAVFS